MAPAVLEGEGVAGEPAVSALGPPGGQRVLEKRAVDPIEWLQDALPTQSGVQQLTGARQAQARLQVIAFQGIGATSALPHAFLERNRDSL